MIDNKEFEKINASNITEKTKTSIYCQERSKYKIQEEFIGLI